MHRPVEPTIASRIDPGALVLAALFAYGSCTAMVGRSLVAGKGILAGKAPYITYFSPDHPSHAGAYARHRKERGKVYLDPLESFSLRSDLASSLSKAANSFLSSPTTRARLA